MTYNQDRIRRREYERRYRSSVKGKYKRSMWQRKNQKRLNTRDRTTKRHFKHRYGITIEDYNLLYTDQHGVCAICKKPSNSILVVDHDHKTGGIRGLLCRLCNSALGFLRDDPKSAYRAAKFLRGTLSLG